MDSVERTFTRSEGRTIDLCGGRVVAGLFLNSQNSCAASVGSSGTSEKNAPSAQSTGTPITEGDRKDGIGSLCKVFQVYGLPKNDHDATEAVRNAAELFKLAGNQSPERSEYILTTIAQEFRSGKLSQRDCAEAGAPIATTEENEDNSTPDIHR